MASDASTKAIMRGLLGGLAATTVMDLACAGLFVGVGMPSDLTYSFIGNVVGSFFLRVGIDLPGRRILGAVVHVLIGIALGGLFGWAVSRVGTLRTNSLRRSLLLAVLYAEILSQPILATAPLLGNMTSSEILQWYALSVVMHAVYGIVLGAILSYGQKAAASPKYAV